MRKRVGKRKRTGKKGMGGGNKELEEEIFPNSKILNPPLPILHHRLALPLVIWIFHKFFDTPLHDLKWVDVLTKTDRTNHA